MKDFMKLFYKENDINGMQLIKDAKKEVFDDIDNELELPWDMKVIYNLLKKKHLGDK